MKQNSKKLAGRLEDGSTIPAGWRLEIFQFEDNLSYIALHEPSGEAILVDPVREDIPGLKNSITELIGKGVRLLFVIDTHTHADHVSAASTLAEHFRVPLVMHAQSPSQRVHLRVSKDTFFPSQAGAIELFSTPGHTPCSLTVTWGPFLFTGDTILYGDSGRDDLPGGDPTAHYESLVKIKSKAKPEMIFLPGHDSEGRHSSWKTQLETNLALKQSREDFIQEAAAYRGPSPKHLQESLFENFK